MKCPRCIEIHLLERWRLSQWNMYYLIDIDGSTSQINYWNRIECYAIGLKLKHFCSKNLFYGFDLHQPEYIITHEAVLIPCFCLKSQHNSTASGSESHSIPTLNPPLNLLCLHTTPPSNIHPFNNEQVKDASRSQNDKLLKGATHQQIYNRGPRLPEAGSHSEHGLISNLLH